jgi:serine acetyltransferase
MRHEEEPSGTVSLGDLYRLWRGDLTANRDQGLSKVTMTCLRLRLFARAGTVIRRFVLIPIDLICWWWIALVMGAHIPPSIEVGSRLRIPHGGRGLVIHESCRIGSDVTLYHRVTLGQRGPELLAPVLEDGVYVGTGAILLGAIRVHEDARIGAGAVVIKDVTAKSTYVGYPSRRPASGELNF